MLMSCRCLVDVERLRVVRQRIFLLSLRLLLMSADRLYVLFRWLSHDDYFISAIKTNELFSLIVWLVFFIVGGKIR